MSTCPRIKSGAGSGLRLPRLPRLSPPGIRLKQSRPACHCEARPPAKRSEADRARAGRWRTARAMAGRGGDLNTRHIVSTSAAFRRIKTVGFHSRFPEGYPMTTTGFSGLNHTACILAPPGFGLPSQGLPSGVTIDLLAKL
ncbi:MAG: hypothetical protein JRJ79_16290 [Deltaproteobacteria bacterium]|nr:hypothetical protein [Deltaproteobacteria bacterium]